MMYRDLHTPVDASHFPVFHEMERVKLFDGELVGGEMTSEEWLASPGCQAVAADLKKTLEGMCDELFGPVEKRWIDEYFPFTEPSFELEIFYNGDWMEVLGCGVIHSGVLDNVRARRAPTRAERRISSLERRISSLESSSLERRISSLERRGRRRET